MVEIPSLVRRLPGRAAALLYPARCAGCGRFGAALCGPCAAAMEPATGPGRCPMCSARWLGTHNCSRCFSWDALDGAVAAFEMTGTARQVVHGLKYGWVTALGLVMATHMEPLRVLRPFDVALPVPLHRSRQRRRGFNQAELLMERLGWPVPAGTLVRQRNTRTQVGLAHRQRRGNVAGAFVYRGATLAGLRVALIDDVVTTGATMNECARVLKEAGARRVFALSFARASYDGARPEQPIID
ncbi:MAG: phosphoribosyltransferase family protein [Tepidiformaceae bacterium]